MNKLCPICRQQLSKPASYNEAMLACPTNISYQKDNLLPTLRSHYSIYIYKYGIYNLNEEIFTTNYWININHTNNDEVSKINTSICKLRLVSSVNPINKLTFIDFDKILNFEYKVLDLSSDLDIEKRINFLLTFE